MRDRKVWNRVHMRCPHIMRDESRSSVSRMFLCGYSVIGGRCMFRLCPLVPADLKKLGLVK